jgi:hypothetical protein
MKKLLALALASASLLASQPALAGPFILDGTDADDHGFASATANFDGWLYNQRALENIASGASLTRTQKVVAALGSDVGTTAGNAAQSAVALSSALSLAGWTVVLLNDSQISDFFANTGPGLHSTGASVIYMDSANNVNGGLSPSEQAIIDANAVNINNFVGSGGGLFTHSQGYGWLSALVPGLLPVFGGDQGIALTAAGNAAFPGLTNADLSTGPYHNIFTNVGSIPILGVDAGGFLAGSAVILGGAGGSITNPDPIPGVIPEPATWAMMLLGFFGLGSILRSQRRRSALALA